MRFQFGSVITSGVVWFGQIPAKMVTAFPKVTQKQAVTSITHCPARANEHRTLAEIVELNVILRRRLVVQEKYSAMSA